MTQRHEITLSDAAQRLGMSWERTWRLVLTGALVGQKHDGKWTVSQASVDRFETVRRATDSNDGGSRGDAPTARRVVNGRRVR